MQPDLLFISRERADFITPANIQGAPDLIVEIRSESTAERDEILKRQRYADHGVEEYWLVNPEAAAIAVLRSGGQSYSETALYTAGQTLTSPKLHGLSIPLNHVFLAHN